MFENLVRFFTLNSRINYTLFFLIIAVGIYSYARIPKEIFPSFELDMVSVTGVYNGASLDVIDKMAVTPLEEELVNLDGIKELTTVITSGRFTVVLELEKGIDKYNTADKVKDALAIAKKDFPEDMDDPVVSVQETRRDLLDIAVTSSTLDISQLKPLAQKLKERLAKIKYINDIEIFGDSDLYYHVELDTERIAALGLNFDSVATALAKLSYIFPLGKIEDQKRGFFYLSTANGKKNAEDWGNTLIKVGEYTLYLKDIAAVSKRYEDSLTLYHMDAKPALNIVLKQDQKGNAMVLGGQIQKVLEEFHERNPDVEVFIHDDNTEKIKDRLNIVISNILLGLIIIALLVAWLINMRMAFIITLGIPTSFLIGAFVFYLSGYTINMISLIGVLLALGIIVDDAIVVSENIQQKIEEGYDSITAAIVGTKEMALPVTIASVTTLFAFIPALMISGTMGEVMKLVPIAVSALVIASLLEAFLFLPIHAAHTLDTKHPVRSWEKANELYSRIIHHLMKHKKSFLFTFIIVVPLLSFLLIKTSKFQMFPQFDSTTIHIALKSNVDTSVEEMDAILLEIQRDLYANKEKFSIDHVGSVAGYRKDSANNSENYPYVGDITVELTKLKAQNAVDEYITPYLSFYYDEEGRTRDLQSDRISKKLAKFIDAQHYKEKYGLKEISVVQKKVGPIKSDIMLGLIGNDNRAIIEAAQMLEKKLSAMGGITSVADTVQLGIDEIKLHINPYGESLGVDEQMIGKALSNLYLTRKVSSTFNREGLLEVKVEGRQKDNLQELEELPILLADGRSVSLREVTTFETIRNFEKVTKDRGVKNFYIFANVDPKIITADEVLELLEPDLKALSKEGIRVVKKGEKEKKEELRSDMLSAASAALLLILLSLLYLLNSYRESLILLSVIPFSILGVMVGHLLLGLNIGMPTLIGTLGLSGVVINDGIIMLVTLKSAQTIDDVYRLAAKRFRPIVLTSVTTLVGLATLIFFPVGQAVIFQPLAVALGFGLAWGTVLNLLYLPILYTYLYKGRFKQEA